MAGTPLRLTAALDLTLQGKSLVGTAWGFDSFAFYKIGDLVTQDGILYQCIKDVDEVNPFFNPGGNPAPGTPPAATFWESVSINADVQYVASAPSVRSDGSALRDGDLFIDSDTGVISVRDSDDWVELPAGGSEIQYSSNRPTTREDGSPLEVGDLWVSNINRAIQLFHGPDTDDWTFIASNGHLAGAGAPTSSTTRRDGSDVLHGDIYVDTSTGLTTNPFYVFDTTDGWRQWSHPVRFLNQAQNQTYTYDPFTKLAGGEVREDIHFNALELQAGTWTEEFDALGDPNVSQRHTVQFNTLRLEDSDSNQRDFSPLTENNKGQQTLAIRDLTVGGTKYSPLGGTNTTINENTFRIDVGTGDDDGVTYDPLTPDAAALTHVRFANATIAEDGGVHTVTIGSTPYTEAEWEAATKATLDGVTDQSPSVAAVRGAFDDFGITPSTGSGLETDPELHTVTFPTFDTDGNIMRDDDGNVITTRWRIVGSEPADIASPVPTGASYTQYAGVTTKTVNFTVSDESEVFTAASFTVTQGGTTLSDTNYDVLYYDSTNNEATLSTNTVVRVQVDVTNYDDQVVDNIRVVGSFSVAEGPATRDFPSITAIITAQAAPGTQANFTNTGSSVEQFTDLSSLADTDVITIELVAAGGALSATPAKPVVTQVVGASTETYTVSDPEIDSVNTNIVRWTVARNQFDTSNVNTDVFVDYPEVSVLPTGKTDTTNPTVHPADTGNVLVNIVRITPNTLTATYRFDEAPAGADVDLPATLNLFNVGNDDTIIVTYSHDFDPVDPDGTYTLMTSAAGLSTHLFVTNSQTLPLATVLQRGANTLDVRYNDTRDSFYTGNSPDRVASIFAPWYLWFTTDPLTPGAINQSNAVTANNNLVDGFNPDSVDGYMLTHSAGSSNNETLWVAIPTSVADANTLGGTIQTPPLPAGGIGAVKWSTEDLTTDATDLMNLPGDSATVNYQIYQVTTIAAGDTSNIELSFS